MTKAPTASAGSMAGMDHSTMPGMTARPATRPAQGMTGMDHSQMAMPTQDTGEFGADPADEKLKRIVAFLTRDSIVMRRIQADPSLRATWADTAVRRLIINSPGTK